MICFYRSHKEKPTPLGAALFFRTIDIHFINFGRQMEGWTDIHCLIRKAHLSITYTCELTKYNIYTQVSLQKYLKAFWFSIAPEFLKMFDPVKNSINNNEWKESVINCLFETLQHVLSVSTLHFGFILVLQHLPIQSTWSILEIQKMSTTTTWVCCSN